MFECGTEVDRGSRLGAIVNLFFGESEMRKAFTLVELLVVIASYNMVSRVLVGADLHLES